ncbi:MAG: glucose-1-phosphate adenylyltransferase [Oscillospiraceae bacterium]|nr:glucose-1-phosphate adenylyltransferase [Oscillospiraceae bacterium]
MLLAGGQGSRLYVLTSNVAKPAVPFGGKYRIIDFPLSNCTNSGIDTVGVLTQYKPLELNSYIGSGQPWDLDRMDGGVHILPPYMREGDKGTWFKGTANAIYQNIGFVDMYDPEYVVILSGDHIYKMNYDKMLEAHKAAEAACTISVLEVPWDEAPRFGIMAVDGEDNITEFQEKPKQPKSNLAGTLESLWDANMDMLSRGDLDLLEDSWPIYARLPSQPPAYIGKSSLVEHSVVTQGCEITGTVKNSVLSPGARVEDGAEVHYSVLMPGVTVKRGAVVRYAILGENCQVDAGAVVGADPESCEPDEWGITVLGPGTAIAAGEMVKPKTMLNSEHKEVSR